MLCDTAKPNAAHLKLAQMEAAGKLKAVITQNIDNLHQMAGSKNVLELHGSVYRNYCMKCGKSYDFRYMKAAKGVPKCTCGGIIKPDVVLYEEGLDDYTIQESVRAISEAQVLIIGGPSLAVLFNSGIPVSSANAIQISGTNTPSKSKQTISMSLFPPFLMCQLRYLTISNTTKQYVKYHVLSF